MATRWFVGTTSTNIAGMQVSGNSYLARENLGTADPAVSHLSWS